ncbi:MAG: hypothetical protein LBP95_05680 [Deltaproteobacteria bacterium]|nr:hypothetical protein [Deltaproteobacteria bacterium]
MELRERCLKYSEVKNDQIEDLSEKGKKTYEYLLNIGQDRVVKDGPLSEAFKAMIIDKNQCQDQGQGQGQGGGQEQGQYLSKNNTEDLQNSNLEFSVTDKTLSTQHIKRVVFFLHVIFANFAQLQENLIV